MNGPFPSKVAVALDSAEQALLERITDEVFDRRLEGASSKRLGELLDKAPNRAPDIGDEYEV